MLNVYEVNTRLLRKVVLCAPLVVGPGLVSQSGSGQLGTTTQPILAHRSLGNRVRRVDAGLGWRVHELEQDDEQAVDFVWNKAIYRARKLATEYGS